MTRPQFAVLFILSLGFGSACGGDDLRRACDYDAPLSSRAELRCSAEFDAQAARPADSQLPGAYTIKTIVDQANGDAVYFLDTKTYPMHRPFAVDHLGYPPDGPFVNEYFYPQRRFLLGSVTYYEEPGVWAYELAPYDTASPEMIARAFGRLSGAAFFGGALRYRPTSDAQESRAAELPEDVPVVTTEALQAGISFTPLSYGEVCGKVRITMAEDLGEVVPGTRELVVLDRAPHELVPVGGLVVSEAPPPLAEVALRSVQRPTPLLALRGASEVLESLRNGWACLTVGAFDWSVTEVTEAEAEAWIAAHPAPVVTVPALDFTVNDLVDIDGLGLDDVAFAGGTAAHAGELRAIGGDVVSPDGFVIPVVEYRDFLEETGLGEQLRGWIGDPSWSDPVNRAVLADRFPAEFAAHPVKADLVARVEARIALEFPGQKVRFVPSTNAEDLVGIASSGLHETAVFDPEDPYANVERTILAVWSGLWSQRAVEERERASIPHLDVGMAILVQPLPDDALATGMALSANLYDPAPGGEDAFVVHAQKPGGSVARPAPGETVDQLIYYYFHNGQPATWLAHSSLVPTGETVLTRLALFQIGRALDAVRRHFRVAYQPPAGWGALPLVVEWAWIPDEDGEGAHMEITQVRPYRGQGE